MSLDFYLDPLIEIGVEVIAIHDAILNRVGTVDGKLQRGLLASYLAKTLALKSLLARLVGLFTKYLTLGGN